MGFGSSGKFIRIGACTVVIAAGTAAALAMGMHAGEMLHAKLAHSDDGDRQELASRYPELSEPATAAQPAALANSLIRSKDQERIALAAPNPPQQVEQSKPPQPEVVASAADVPPPAEPARDPATTAPAVVAAATPEPAAKPVVVASAEPSVKPAAAVHRRPNAVLDDGQIASIKRRLHLTPYQEHMWPAVESELRRLAVAAPARQQQAKRGTKETPKLELSSNDVARLKTAALPLIMSFNEEQRGELRNMAHVTGLDRYAP
jgi:predicted lipid-binding transport protein (Tim44 family)